MFSRLISSSGATFVEIMAVLVVLTFGITASLSIVGSGQKQAQTTEETIKAINIAREGIEAFINIRDTNWVKFSSDRLNCWDSLNYDFTCISQTALPHISKISTGSYRIYNNQGLWYLSGVSSANTPDSSYSSAWVTYLGKYGVIQDGSGFTDQTGSYTQKCNTINTSTGCVTPFTRELHVSYLGTGVIRVQSIVRWMATGYSGSALYKKVILSSDLTNWRSKY